MWVYKKKYKGQKIGVKGFGILDTNTLSAELIYKYSLLPQFTKLIRFIERAEEKKKPSKKKSTKQLPSNE